MAKSVKQTMKDIASKDRAKMKAKMEEPVRLPVTGLGETIEQITDLTNEKASVLLRKIKKEKAGDAVEILELAYQYGLAERRRRKLARKVNSGSEE